MISTVASGTQLNNPPEYFLKNLITGENLDRWCTSMVLYFVIERTVAFYSCEEIKYSELRLSTFHSQEYLDFIKSMLNKNPKKRLNHFQIENHPWISSLNK